MRLCPRCLHAPGWKYAHARSAATGIRCQMLLFYPCVHCDPFGRNIGVVPVADAPKWERAWDRNVVRLFRDYTRRWTREERKRFWARVCDDATPLYVKPPPAPPVLAKVIETRQWNEAHPAAKIDPSDADTGESNVFF